MDFKGITWAGNIYDKFEAMCLEVEEVMYEDTVKYVENQVQKVGVSVKKFYSEIMQDLLPPSCVDPMKVVAEDLLLNPHAHTDINKKTKLSIFDNQRELKKKKSEDEDISDLTSEESSLTFRNDAISLLPPGVLVENTSSGVCSTKTKLGVYRRPIGAIRISQTNRDPKIPQPVTPISGDDSGMLGRDMRRGRRVASVDMNATTSSELSVTCDLGEAVNEKSLISDASIESSASSKCLQAESMRQEKENSGCTFPASDKVLSAESLRQKKSDFVCTSSCHRLPTKPIDILKKNNSFSQMNSNTSSDTSCVDSAGEGVIVSYEENFDIELIENEEVPQSVEEIFEPIDRSELEESCVLVERDKLHFISQGTKKQKSYKKKISQVLSSKLRSTRKQDQCVSQYKDSSEKSSADMVIPDLTRNSSNRRLPTSNSFGSDWELL